MLKNKKYGFTIIEVVLVLAIAGLIFLMVFVAVPALQRNQRDVQRKNDAARVKDAIERYRSNNKGKMPQASGSFSFNAYGTPIYGRFWNYIGKEGDTFKDPDGRPYSLGAYNANFSLSSSRMPDSVYGEETNRSRIYVYLFGNPDTDWAGARAGFKCEDNGAVSRVPNQQNRYAIQLSLESGGVYCIDG